MNPAGASRGRRKTGEAGNIMEGQKCIFQSGLMVQFSFSADLPIIHFTGWGEAFSHLPFTPLSCVALSSTLLFPALFLLNLSHPPDRRSQADQLSAFPPPLCLRSASCFPHTSLLFAHPNCGPIDQRPECGPQTPLKHVSSPAATNDSSLLRHHSDFAAPCFALKEGKTRCKGFHSLVFFNVHMLVESIPIAVCIYVKL